LYYSLPYAAYAVRVFIDVLTPRGPVLEGVGLVSRYLYIGGRRLYLVNPGFLLRLEGVAVFAAATVAYYFLGGPLWLYLALALAPDLAMLGYLAGPRLGSRVYNAAHTYVAPLALAGLAWWAAVPTALLVALVWAAHIGVDRAVGYGLKYQTGFKDTHLGRVGTDAVEAVRPDPEPGD
jgi:hypothetical protein